MTTRNFALIYGIVFLLVGIAGFIPAFLSPVDQPIALNTLHGRLFGLFPVNILHSLVHVAFGVWGVLAYRSYTGARTYAQVTAIAYAILVVFGLIPGLNMLFGFLPLHSHDIWLHFLLALPAAYFGFVRHREQVETAGHRTATHTR